MEAGQYALSPACGDGELRGQRGKDQYYHRGLDRDCLYQPAMVYISVRPQRYSYDLLRDSGEFVINLTTEKLLRAADWCGVKSGRDTDKWKEMHLTPGRASRLDWAPVIEEAPVNIECRVTEVKELGSHHMFLARVEAVQADKDYMDADGRFRLNDAGLIAYSHGEYLELGKKKGSFGYSVKKKKRR